MKLKRLKSHCDFQLRDIKVVRSINNEIYLRYELRIKDKKSLHRYIKRFKIRYRINPDESSFCRSVNCYFKSVSQCINEMNYQLCGEFELGNHKFITIYSYIDSLFTMSRLRSEIHEFRRIN